MNQQNIMAESNQRYNRDQIVIDLSHRDAVVHKLGDMKIQSRPEGEIEELALMLLALPNLHAEMANVDNAEGVRRTLAEDRRAMGLPAEVSDLDVLMQLIRQDFSMECDGWIPTIGKNRVVEAIEGLPHIGVGEGDPRRLELTIMFAPRTSASGRGLRVGVLDTGLFPNPSLDGRYVSGDFVKKKNPQPLWAGHATFVAGTILQRAPGAELDIRRVLSDEDGRASSWQVATQMASFLRSGVDVLNMSLGTITADGKPGLVLERAADVVSAGMVVVASAGNHGDIKEPRPADDSGASVSLRTIPRTSSSPMWPAAQHNVVAVAAAKVSQRGRQFEFAKAAFSPHDVPWLDLEAPGVDIESTYLDGAVESSDVTVTNGTSDVKSRLLGDFVGAAIWSGTSFAAGAVTGEIARIAQERGVSAQEALAEIKKRPPEGQKYDIRPLRFGRSLAE